MDTQKLCQLSNWKIVTNPNVNKEIVGAYIGDLMSYVMGNGKPNNAWLTIQSHINVVAVAMIREFSCVILCDHLHFSKEVIDHANKENIILIECPDSMYQASLKLGNLGI